MFWDHVPDSDRHYVDLVRKGNTHAYSTLVDRHKDRAMTLAVRLLGKREEAEEIVQDAFLRGFRALGSFRGDAKFGTWLYRILYNLCLTRISRRRQSEISMDDPEGALLDQLAPEGEVGAQEKLEDEELRDVVGHEIDLLPTKIRMAIHIFYLQESSYEETALTMGIPVGTVKTYLHRGRNLLRKRLAARMKQEEYIS
jgi:RNA polymerase sigma-70 factor (ECF subfamily)